MVANEPFSRVHETGEHLVGVKGYFFVDATSDDMLVAIRFHFDSDIVVIAVREDDSLAIFGTAWNCTEEGVVSRELSGIAPWNAAVTKPLLWSWRMINQQGYFDGVQLQFGENVDDSIVQVQLIAIASEIKIRDL
jgi:hypothetical protein